MLPLIYGRLNSKKSKYKMIASESLEKERVRRLFAAGHSEKIDPQSLI